MSVALRITGALVALVALEGATACAPAAHRRAQRLEGRYTLGNPGEGWVEVPAGGADRAWRNERAGATLYADSNCGPRFDEQHAGALATELLGGLQDVVRVEERALPLAGRVGVARTHTARLDGVPVHLVIGVLNRDACTYDFVVIAPPEHAALADAGWRTAVEGFAPTRQPPPAAHR
jgi:hypothetical protein